MRICLFLLASTALFAQSPPQSLTEYLELTPAQTAEFLRNGASYSEWYIGRFERSAVIYSEIAEEIRRDVVDSLALGLRYAELENLRRESVARESAILAQHQSLLTASQTARLQSLIEARRLSGLGQEAEFLRLIGNVDGNRSYCPFCSGVFTARPGEKAPVRQNAAAAPTPLEKFLQLSPEQIARYRANQQEFRAWQQRPTEYDEANRQACEALASSPLDPARAGIPLARLAALFREGLVRAEELIKANEALLTSEQRIRLQILDEARGLPPTLAMAESEAFLRRPDGHNYFYFSSDPNYYGPSTLPAAFSRPNLFYLGCPH